MMGDDLLGCVLGGVYTDVEKTLIELERAPRVQDNRNAFQTAMQDRFVAVVEQLSGKRVAHFVSTHSIGPDLEIELFFLADRPAAGTRVRLCLLPHSRTSVWTLAGRVALNRRRLAGPDRALLIRR
jgi:uncharacterized protein YbcI